MRNLLSIVEGLTSEEFNITKYVRSLMPRTTRTYNLMDDDKVEFEISTTNVRGGDTVVTLQTIAPLDGSDYKQFNIVLTEPMTKDEIDSKLDKYFKYYNKVKSQNLEYVRHLMSK